MKKRSWIRFAAYAFFAANLVVSGVIWWHGSSFYVLHAYPGSLFIAYGRLSGLLLQLALLMELVLIARIGPLERTFGFMTMNKLHRLVGGWLATLIIVHPLLLVLGYGGYAPADAWSQFLSFLTSWEDVSLALFGTIVLLIAAVLSAPMIRRRMPYGVWHLFHLGMYVAAVCVFFHQIVAGDFSGSSLAIWYWIAVNAFVIGAVTIYRVCLPIGRLWYYGFTVKDVIDEGEGVTSIVITGRHLDRFRFEAGQHAKLSFLKRHLWAPHPFSFSAAPNGTSLRFSIKALGDFTKRIPTLTPGTRVIIDGPLGAFTASNAETKKLLLVAGGIGITPLFSMFASASSSERDVTLLFAARNATALTFFSELQHMVVAHSNLHAVCFIAEGEDPPAAPGMVVQHGFINEVAIRRLVPDAAERDAYVCGPPKMMDGINQALLAIGVPLRRIHDERFSF